MGFFDRLYYGKAGKRDYSEMDMPKNRVSLFFLVLKDHLFDLIKVNLLQLVFWIPFIIWTYLNLMAIQSLDIAAVMGTENGAAVLLSEIASFVVMWLIGLVPCIAITGPSSAGAAYIMRNWARDQHAFLFSDFKDAFKGNWKQALGVSVLTSFAPLLTYTAVAYYGQLANSNLAMMLPLVLVVAVMMVWTLMLPLLYPMMIGYELTFRNLIKNALLMAVAYFTGRAADKEEQARFNRSYRSQYDLSGGPLFRDDSVDTGEKKKRSVAVRERKMAEQARKDIEREEREKAAAAIPLNAPVEEESAE